MTGSYQSPTLKAIVKMEDLFSEALDKLESRIEAVSKEMSARFEKVQDSVEKVDRTIEKTGGGALSFFSKIGSIMSGVGVAVITVGKIFKGLLSIVTSVAKGIVRGITGAIRIVTRLGQAVWREAMTISKGLDEVAKMSVRVGESARAMTEYRLVTELTGTSMSALAVGLRTGSRNLADYRQGTGEAKDAFEKLGITQQMANEEIKNGSDLLEVVADRLHLLKDEAEKTAVVQEIFGRSGTELRPVLNMQAEGIRRVRQEARALGISFDDIELGKVEALNDEISRVELAIRGLKERVLIDLAPTFIRVVTRIKQKFVELRPEILAVLHGLPAAAKEAFAFLKNDPSFYFAQAAKTMWVTAKFVFKEIRVLLVASFDIALATIEDRWKTRFTGLRDFMTSLGLMEPLEFDKLFAELEKIEEHSHKIKAATQGQVQVAGEWYTVTKDISGQISTVSKGYSDFFHVVRDETGKVTKFMVTELNKPSRVVSGQLEDMVTNAYGAAKREGTKVFNEFVKELKRVGDEVNRHGDSIISAGKQVYGAATKELRIRQAIMAATEQTLKYLRMMSLIPPAAPPGFVPSVPRKKLPVSPEETPPRPTSAPGGDGGSAFENQPYFDPEQFRIKGFQEGFNQLVKHADAAGDSMARMGEATSQALYSSFQINFFDPMTGKLMQLEEIGKQVFRNLLNFLAEYAMREAALGILRGIGGGLSSIFGGGDTVGQPGSPHAGPPVPSYFGVERSEKGNVFDHGHLTQLARGALFEQGIRKWAMGGQLPEIITEPTYFTTKDGKGNVAGEAGTEFVMPAARTPGGAMGVKAVLPPEASRTVVEERNVTIHYQPQFTSPDVDGIRREARAHEERIRAIIQEEMGYNRGMKRLTRRNVGVAY